MAGASHLHLALRGRILEVPTAHAQVLSLAVSHHLLTIAHETSRRVSEVAPHGTQVVDRLASFRRALVALPMGLMVAARNVKWIVAQATHGQLVNIPVLLLHLLTVLSQCMASAKACISCSNINTAHEMAGGARDVNHDGTWLRLWANFAVLRRVLG